jgi:hypothetical protein
MSLFFLGESDPCPRAHSQCRTEMSRGATEAYGVFKRGRERIEECQMAARNPFSKNPRKLLGKTAGKIGWVFGTISAQLARAVT